MKEEREIIFPEFETGYAFHPHGYIISVVTNIRIKGTDRKYYLSKVIKSVLVKEEPNDRVIFQVVKEFIVEVYKNLNLLIIDKVNKELTNVFNGKKIHQLSINQVSERERITKKYIDI